MSMSLEQTSLLSVKLIKRECADTRALEKIMKTLLEPTQAPRLRAIPPFSTSEPRAS